MNLDNPISGAGYFFQGLQLIRKANLRRFVILPLLCNFVLFGGLLILVLHWIQEFNQWIDSFLPSWLTWLNWLIWPIFFIAFFMVIFYTFTLVANLIATPFNALLSEKTQKYLTGQSLADSSLLELITKETPRALKRQWQMIVYYIPRALLCLILFFIPVIQIIAPIIWFLFNAWAMSIQYIDYPTDNNHVSFLDMRKQLKSKPLLSLSFGTVITIATLIPIINFFVMPIAVVAATDLWVHEWKKEINTMNS